MRTDGVVCIVSFHRIWIFIVSTSVFCLLMSVHSLSSSYVPCQGALAHRIPYYEQPLEEDAIEPSLTRARRKLIHQLNYYRT